MNRGPARSARGEHRRLTAWPDRLRVLGDALGSALWPIPVAMIALAVLLWGAAAWLDRALPAPDTDGIPWLHSGSGADASNLLSTLLTAIVTISSIVFSITIVTLTLAANQFGSRLVRLYMSDLWSKLALGLFVMTVMYCLLALRLVEQDMAAAQVPHVTVTVGVLLSAACIVVLVLFLHAIARSIVADEVIRRVAAELEVAIGSLEDGACAIERGPVEAAAGECGSHSPALLRSAKEGYVQAVRYEDLVRAAQEHEALVELTFQPGAFMCRDGWLARVYAPSGPGDALEEKIHRAVLIGRLRTPTQDLEYSMRHLVDVALRALSPGINDANTAMVVIDRLRGALSKLMRKRLRPGVYRDAAGRPRLVAPCHGYADVLEYAFAQIRHAAAPQPAVVHRLLLAFERIAEHAVLGEQLAALETQARLAAEQGLSQAATETDRRSIQDRLAATLAKVRGAAATGVAADAARPAAPRLASGGSR